MKLSLFTRKTGAYAASCILLLIPLWSFAEPVVSLDHESNTVLVDPRGASAQEAMRALAQKIGFELSGELEASAEPMAYSLEDTPEKVINHLASPQSVIIMYTSDDKGRQRISAVELLPTGDAESKFLNNGAVVGFNPRKMTGDPEKDRFHMERDQRRAERHARGLGRRNQPNYGIVDPEELKQENSDSPSE